LEKCRTMERHTDWALNWKEATHFWNGCLPLQLVQLCIWLIFANCLALQPNEFRSRLSFCAILSLELTKLLNWLNVRVSKDSSEVESCALSCSWKMFHQNLS
jgi:hypothetical protein